MLPYRADIDGLRAVAVLLIVFFHLRLAAVPGGFVGVDVFFVISGYLITALILREHATGTFSFANFYLRRLRRLGPALLVTVALTLVAGWFILPPSLYQTTAQSALASIFSVSNFYFWLQSGYFDVSSAYKPLLHTWSLSVEEQFYLIWPALMIGFLAMAGRKAVVIAVAVVSLVTLAANQAVLNSHPDAAFFLTPLRAFEFGIGAILAITGWQARHVATAYLTSIVGLMGILYLGNTFNEDTAFPGLNAIFPALATAMMIYAGPRGLMNRVLALPPVRYIGQISYSVYLVHWPVIVFAIFLQGEAIKITDILALLSGILILGAVMYHVVETPFRHKTGPYFRIPTKALGAFCIVAAAAVSLASWGIHRWNGVPDRYDPKIVALLDELGDEIERRAMLTGEWDCNATENSAPTYLESFDDCLPQAADNLVVVLGDSHAADVYMGLKATFPNAAIAQLTGNECSFSRAVPVNQLCAPVMARWQAWIDKNAERIGAIIYTQEGASLMARGASGSDTVAPALIATLADRLDDFTPPGVPFYFWGPRATFAPQINIAIAGSRDSTALRNYYPPELFAQSIALDRQLAAVFADKPQVYVSTIDTACNTTCPVFTKDDTLFIIDAAHWTRAGAMQVTAGLADQSPRLLQLLKP